MLEEILNQIHNFFVVKDGVHKGNFVISSSALSLDFLQEGQYFRVVGSVFNDGVYQYPADGLQDEEFVGEIWAMAVPPKFIALVSEIETWMNNNKKYVESPFTSESYSGYYSYTKGTSANGSQIGWQDVFASRLNPWRKLS